MARFSWPEDRLRLLGRGAPLRCFYRPPFWKVRGRACAGRLRRAVAVAERQRRLALMYGDQPIRKHRDDLARQGYMLYHFLP